MKKFLLILAVGVLFGCEVKDDNGEVIVSAQFSNYSEETAEKLEKLIPPVTLLSKSSNFGEYSVSVQDATGNIYYMGDMSTVANGIGEYYEVGDTVVHKSKSNFTKEEILNKMESPVILVAKDKFFLPVNTVIVKDANGWIEEFGDWAIHELEVGDTIK